MFYIDARGVYRRGSLYMIQPIVSYCYVTIYVLCMPLFRLEKVESRKRRPSIEPWHFRHSGPGGRYLSGYIIRCPAFVGIMISILLLYIIYQEQLISTDPLTGLNNRNRFETYMLSLFSNGSGPKMCICL